MSRIAGLANTIRNSGARLGPLDAVFAFSDYANGKQEGEDDIRAGVGATGSTLGGWGGALAGGQAGATLGAFGGPVGIAVGGALGAIAGGTIGGFAGGWGADRVDETIRGKQGNKQMKYYDSNYNLIGEDNNPEPNQTDLFGLAATGAVGTAGAMTARNAFKYGTNPMGVFNAATNMGLSNGQALKVTGGSLVDDLVRAGSRLPGWGKVLAAGGAAYLGNKAMGNPAGKLSDTITNQATNFDNDPENARKQQQLRQMKNDAEMQRNQRQMNTPTLEQLNSDPYQQLVDQRGEKMLRQQQDNEDKIFKRDRKAALEQSRYSLSAQNSRDLMAAWSDSARNVNAAMQTISNARF